MSERIPAGGPFKAAIGIHEQINADSIKESRKLWSTYCTNDQELCKNFFSIVNSLSTLISEARIEDIDVNNYQGIDKELLSMIKKIRNIYSLYLSGSIISFGEYVLAKFNKSLTLSNNKTLEKGDISLVPLEEAILLASLNYIEPIKTISYKIIEDKQKKS